MLIRLSFIMGFVVLIAGMLDAQQPPIWRSWSIEDGMDETPSSAITQLPGGTILINHGDVEHASVLDGYEITHIPNPCPHSKIHVDMEGGLWSVYATTRLYGSESENDVGFMHWEENEKRWRQYSPLFLSENLSEQQDYTPFGRGFSFIPLHNNSIIYVLHDSIWEYRPELDSSALIVSISDTELIKFNQDIQRANNGSLWIPSVNGLLQLNRAERDRKQWEWFEYPFPKEMGLQDGAQLIVVPDSGLYMTAQRMADQRRILMGWEGETWKTIFQLEDRDIVLGFRDSLDRIWLETSPHQLLLCENDQIQEIPNENALSKGGRLYDIMIGDHGVFWLALSLGGSTRYMPAAWRTPTSFSSPLQQYMYLFEDQNGAIWFGNWKGLYKYDQNEMTFIPASADGYFGALNPQNVCVFNDGRIAFGTYQSSFLFYNPHTEEYEFIEHTERSYRRIFPNDKQLVFVIAQDKKTEKYELGTFDGNSYQFLFSLSQPQLPRVSIIRDIFQSKNKDVWIGHMSFLGPIRYRNGALQIFDAEDGYNDDGAIYYLELKDGTIWAGGRRSVHAFDGTRWTLIRSGLDRVTKMIQASDGSVWVTAFNGLFRFAKGSWVHLTKDDGLSSPMVWNVIEDRQKQIWIATSNGICRHYPEADQDPPRVFIPKDKNVHEISANSEAQFVYSGMDKWKFTEKHRLLYSHRIDDGNWSPFQEETIATYANIPAGSHRFDVRAMDRNWNESDPASWDFIVSRLWYQEPTFLFLAGTGTLLILFFACLAVSRHCAVVTSNIQLHQANEKLCELDQLKSAFVSQASHDLRTPLTAIKSSLDNLIRGVGGGLNERQQKVVDRALRSVNRLGHLVNDVLDINRIESGRMALEKSEVLFESLVRNVIHENQTAADLNDITIKSDGLNEQCPIHLDVGKMERVVGELISNAIKYTPEGGSVEVLLWKEHNQIVLSIQDSGIGMTPDECEKIWERFYRTNASRKFAKGSGLGLSIAKELVELHEGTIDVESMVGKGTRFILRLSVEEK